MDEVSMVIQELSSIISELEDIRNCLNSNFKGIYTERIASHLDWKIEKLYTAKNKLNNIDRSAVDED